MTPQNETNPTNPHNLPTKSPIIGIAGGIGSGKSAVAQILAELGCIISNADEIVRHILQTDENVKKQLLTWWGPKILDQKQKNTLSRPAIAKIVFQDQSQRKRLEQLLHPIVEQQRKEHWQDACTQAAKDNTTIPALVIDAPLLFEAGLADQCAAIIFVAVTEENRLARLKNTRNWDAHELKKRENAQWDLDRKREYSDYVIDNNGSTDELRGKVQQLLTTIIQNETPSAASTF